MEGLLVVVPCGKDKIWRKFPNRGPTPAGEAYIGQPFVMNRAYADRFAERWVVLSAKYGFVWPEEVIPGPYNTTFKKKASGPVAITELQEQTRSKQLDRFETVVGLGGKEYRQAVADAFASTSAEIRFPFAGLRGNGDIMGQIKRAIASGNPFPESGTA